MIRSSLAVLVEDRVFAAEAFGEKPPAKRVLGHDAETGIFVLAHVFQPGAGGNPHSHAPYHEVPAWAVSLTGGDLDAMDRWRFRKGRDRIVDL